ncbi:MAG TPA: hypothetical protein VK644_05295 [Chitinophagaceae bacterium]|nr:hypothetical protein [Chitinophagaceae bacterium]
MRVFLTLVFIFLLDAGCQSSAGTEKIAAVPYSDIPAPVRVKRRHADSAVIPPVLKPYKNIEYQKTELLQSAPGTKSVLFNSTGSRLYAMNLEGLSVYEFDQPSRKIIREFKFKATKGTGWDYEKDKPIPSLQEKPVEACLSHDDRILWISLHNAEGIVPIRIDSLLANRTAIPAAVKDSSTQKVKRVRVSYPGTTQKDSFDVPLIKTGKTPKVISRTEDSKYLLVSNWHSYNVSVLETNLHEYPFAKVISTVPVPSIPRGIVVDDKHDRSYVAIMGGATLTVINNTAWMKETEIPVASNPRHIVMDTSGKLFVSYNRLAKIACIEPATGKTLFTASTHAQPRTIILSKNYKFLFVTCYSSDTVDVFKINESNFSKVASLPCKGHPVGVEVFENDTTLEAWVCSYSTGSLSVFSFKKIE